MKNLQESEERLRAILDASPYPITVSDLLGNIMDCNQALLALHHYSSKDEVIGKNAITLFAEKERDTLPDRLIEALGIGPSRAVEYTLLTKDGREFPGELSLGLARDSTGNPIALVAISRDLTERYQYEESLRKAERMAAIGETAAMVGHDLRNPLQGISGAVYVIRQKFGSTGDPETVQMLELIEDAVDHANKIVGDLLDYSREIRLDLTESNVRALIDAAIQQLRVPANVKIENLTESTPSLLLDVPRMQRVFVNLIGNAIDAMPKGGELTMSSTVSSGLLEIMFTDTGEGISDDVMRDLWKPMKTTKPRGIGLGLVICKDYVEAHGGAIKVKSTVGKGSTFTMTLPIRQDAKAPTEATS
jgi:PAS domain S-box-containing protein